MNTNTWNLLTEDNQIFAKGYKSEEQAREDIANFDGCYIVGTPNGYLGWKDDLDMSEADIFDNEAQAYRAIIANKRLSCDGCDVIKCKLHISKA